MPGWAATLDDLPDDTWTYLDSKTVQVGGSTKMAQVDFTLAQKEGPALAVTVYSPEALREERRITVGDLVDRYGDPLSEKAFEKSDYTEFLLNRHLEQLSAQCRE